MSDMDAATSFVTQQPGSKRSSWTSVAFIVESILLLLFLVASLAVLTQVFSSSLSRSVESRTLDAATIAASSIAEHFAADPTAIEEETQLGDLKVVCTVRDEQRESGTMYYADIVVYDMSETGGGNAVYALATSHYEEAEAEAAAVEADVPAADDEDEGETGGSEDSDAS